MPDDTNTPEDDDKNKNQSSSDENNQNDSSSNDNNENNDDEEENAKEEVVFHPHKGKIMQIKPYTVIIKAGYGASYGEPTGDGDVELKLTNKDKKYIYSGVSCKLKLRRDTDTQFSPTGIEEVYTEKDIQLREHIPTYEQVAEYNTILPQKQFAFKDYADYDVNSTIVSRSASDDGLYGFVTEVTHTTESSKLKLKDWGLALENIEKELEFKEMFRSEVIEEVAKSYGLTPIVDLTGLEDDVISWSNKKSMGGNTQSSNDDIDESTENDQCSTTYNLSSKAKVSKKGDIPSDITEDMYAKIGKEDTEYGKWAKGKTPEQILSGLRSVYKWKAGYSDNALYKCPDDYFSTSSINVNCADAARLVKCCMDVIGTKCICIHCPDHYYNAIEVDGKWYTCDLTNRRDCKTKTGSNTFGY